MYDDLTRARFAAKVTTAGPDECWVWTGTKSKAGYGSFHVKLDRGRYANKGAHRVAWEMANNAPVPRGLHVRHACHNPACVNPAHLSVGTAAQNKADSVRSGRIARGEAHHRARLTDAEVAAMREARGAGDTLPKIAGDFGVSVSHAHRIVTGASRQ